MNASKMKENHCIKSVSRAYNIAQENSEATKQLCKIEDEGELRIDDLEVFKTSFWNKPIPQRKFDALINKNALLRQKAKNKPNVEQKSEKKTLYSLFALCPPKPIYDNYRPSTTSKSMKMPQVQKRINQKNLA